MACRRSGPARRREVSMRCKGLAVVATLALLAGCVPSLYPFYTESDLVFEPALLGTWWDGDGGDVSWTFAQGGEKAYDLIHEENGAKQEFQAHLFRLGAVLWLDLYPVTPKEPDFHDMHLVPAHTVSRVWLEDGALRVGMLSYDWIKAAIERKPRFVAHAQLEDGLVLTAPTAQLQKLLRAHADDPEAFGRPGECAREDGRRALCIEAGSTK